MADHAHTERRPGAAAAAAHGGATAHAGAAHAPAAHGHADAHGHGARVAPRSLCSTAGDVLADAFTAALR